MTTPEMTTPEMTTTEAPPPVDTAVGQRRRWARYLVPAGLSAPVLVLLVFSVLWPVVSAAVLSVSHSETSYIADASRYGYILGDSFYREVLAQTVVTSLMATAATLVVGYPLGLYMAFATDRVKRIVIFLILTPLLISVVVRGYALTLLLGPVSPINHVLPEKWAIDLVFTRWAVLIGFVYTFLPYMVLSVNASLTGVDLRMLAAARSLGAGLWYVLRRIVVPLSAPGISSGCVIVCALAMSSVGLPLLLGGEGYQMWLLLVYDQVLNIFDWPMGFAMAMIIFVVIVGLLVLGQLSARLLRGRSR